MRRCHSFLAALSVALLLACTAAAQESIDPRSGRLSVIETDLRLPAGATALELVRMYHDGAREAGFVGKHWRLNWESRLLVGKTEALLEESGIPRTLTLEKAGGAYVASNGERLTRARDGRFALARLDGTAELFDPDGRLVERDEGNGNRVTLSYGENGRLARVEGPFGAFLAFAYDRTGRVARVDTSVGAFVRYDYAGERLGSVIASGSPDPTRYRYDGNNRLVRIENPGAGATEFVYDGRGRVTTHRFADGTQETWQYDDSTRAIRHIDSRGGVTVRQMSADGRREMVTDPAGQITAIDLDGEARPIRITGPTGKAVVLTYDALGRLVKTGDPQTGASAGIAYLDATSLPTSMTRPDGSREDLEYDGQRNLVRVKKDGEVVLGMSYLANGLIGRLSEPGGRERRFAYDAAGRLSTITDGLGRVTRYEYDARGNPARIIDPAGGVHIRVYDAHDRLVAETDPLGAVTRFEYDKAGRLARTVSPGGIAVRIEYDPAETRVRLIDAAGRRAEMHVTPQQLTVSGTDGRTEESRIDPLGRLQEIKDASGRITRFEYDRLGRIISESSPTGRVVKYRYDEQDRPVGVDTGLGGRLMYLWEANDRLAAVVDPTGATERYRYDSKGRLATVIDPLDQETRMTHDDGHRLVSVTTPVGDAAHFTYDTEGRLLSSRDAAGRLTRFDYDPLDNLSAITGPDGAPIRQSYDRAGRRVSQTDAAGRATRFAYDGAGRLASKTLPNGRTVRYRHAPTGELQEVDDGAYPLRYDYDAAGRIIGVVHGALKKSVRYRYDAKGLLASVAGTSGQEIRYRYDGTGRLVAIAPPQGGEIGLVFDAGDRLQSIRYPNGVLGTWSYDPAGRIERIVYRLPASSQTARELSRDYKYDLAGNAIEQRGPDSVAGRQYRYDANGRLVEERAGGEVTAYAYRAGGDRAERRGRGGSVTYQYDQAGRILSAGTERFVHDATGSITRRDAPRGVTRYEFDGEGRLVAAATPRGAVAFGYAPTGDRVWRRGPDDVLIRYVHDGLNLLEELADNGTLRALYVHAPGLDRPLAMIREGQTIFYHADALGTVRFLTDASGQVVATYEVDAFGSLLSALPTAGIVGSNRFIFAGREYDPDVGLYYLRARYYDPGLGRFLSPDPFLGVLDNPETLNRYAYALNAPTRYVDPHGLSPDSPFERLAEYYRRVGDAKSLENLYNARPDLRPAPAVPAAPSASSITPVAPVAPPTASSLPGVAPPQAAPPPANTPNPSLGGTVVAAEAGAASAGSWGSRALDFMTKPRGPFANPLSTYLQPAPGAPVTPSPWTWRGLVGATLKDPKAQAGIFGDALKGAGIGALAGISAAIGEVIVNPTDSSKWANVGWAGLRGAGTGALTGAIWQTIKEAGTKAGAKGIVELVEKTLGRVGPWAAIAAAATPQLVENWKLRKAYDEAEKNKRTQENSPALTPANVSLRLAQLRNDLATVRQLHANLGSPASRATDPLADARAKVAQLEALANPDPSELQRSCTSLDALVKKLKSAATTVATHLRASTRILADADPRVRERPLSESALKAALSQMKLGEQAAAAAHADWKRADNAVKAGEHASPQAGDSLHSESMNMIASAQAGTASQPGGAGWTANLNAFKGTKNNLLVHTRGMMAAVDGHRVVGGNWADFRDIELQAESMQEPKSGDPSSRLAADAAELQVRADAALRTIRARPANPCQGSSSPADAQTHWEAIKQAAQAMVAAYDVRVSKMANFVRQAEQIITVTGPAKVRQAQANRDAAMQREAERLIQDTREWKSKGEQETARLREVQAVVNNLRQIR